MKKSILTVIISTIVLSTTISAVFAANYTKFSSKFIKNFRDCDKYEETVTSEFEDKTFTTTRKIIGWRNGFCKYEETITSPSDQYKLVCSFSSGQVDDLYEAMKSKSKAVEKYDLERFAAQKDAKGQLKYVSIGSETIKGNKAYITWAKFQNNPYFCTPIKIK